MNIRNILIVGGAGYIGSHVNKMLYKQGYRTIILDNLSMGYREAVKWGCFVFGDISELSDLKKVFSDHRIDAVMHFAALLNIKESVIHPKIYYRNNVLATLNLLDCMLEHNVKNIVFSSSASVYGVANEKYISETHACNPINPYGESKLMIEKILRDYSRAYGLKASCLRYFNAAGGDPEGEIPNFRQEHVHLIPLIVQSFLHPDQKKVTLYGTDYPTPDGTCIRDYVHVNDIASAHILALEQLFVSNNSFFCYNLGSGKGHSVREVISLAEKVIGRNLQTTVGMRRKGDPPYLLANTQKANSELNWKPHYTLEQIIEHAWQAHAARG